MLSLFATIHGMYLFRENTNKPKAGPRSLQHPRQQYLSSLYMLRANEHVDSKKLVVVLSLSPECYYRESTNDFSLNKSSDLWPSGYAGRCWNDGARAAAYARGNVLYP